MSPEAEPGQVPLSRASRFLTLYLRLIGAVSLLAFAAAVMPQKWIVEIAEALGFDPFPHSPLTFYLARHLSLMYGFVGVLLLVIAADLSRYRRLVHWVALCTVALGVLQWVIDTQSSLPAWWTWGESLSTIAGGVLMVVLSVKAETRHDAAI